MSRPQRVYALHLTETDNGIAVGNDREHADYTWRDVYHVYQNKTATYLYMTPDRAFILPHSCVDEGADALRHLMEKKLPAGKYTVLK